jgi:DHA1 family tetracycline resistance protein-like MFS transporter
MAGFAGFIASQLVLITAPQASYVFLGLSVILEAGSIATVSPLVDRMAALTVDPRERARILSILYVIVISLTSPFGWIAGTLSETNKNLPFILNITQFATGAALVYLAGRASQKKESLAVVVGQ